MKGICQKINGQSKADNITKRKKKENFASCPQIVNAVVEIPRFGFTLTPWVQWETDASPLWWRAYNNVKHQRHEHFSKASLKNRPNAVAGLFVLLLFYYQDEGENGQLAPNPTIFRTGELFHVDKLMWGIDINVHRLVANGNG